MSKKYVVGYVRVSGKSQVDKDGPVRQKMEIQKFCQAHGLNLKANYEDLAVTGTMDGLDRPEFVRMLSESEEDPQVVAIVVERMDRLARDLMVSEMLLAECRTRKLAVYEAATGLLVDINDSNADPTRVLIRQLMGALAQWQKSVLVLKLKASRDRMRQETGACEGAKPFGFGRREKTILELVKRWVVLDSALRAKDLSNRLNETGFKTRQGKDWTAKSVYDRIFPSLGELVAHLRRKPGRESGPHVADANRS